METIWFINVAFMFAMYIVLDGFDLGAGILHLFVARTDVERRTIINAIGPFWDGNEVWLLAAGGTLYFAFPILYASLFSGFYIPFILVLWLLMFRALGIELREHGTTKQWHTFWDASFGIASVLLAFLFGVALGNILRGVPLTEDGYFHLPLITSLTSTESPGVLDWFTLLVGVLSVLALTVHGAQYLAYKTTDELRARALRVAERGWFITLLLLTVAMLSLLSINSGFFNNFSQYPWGIVFPLLVLAAFVAVTIFNKSGKHAYAFISSSAFLFFTFASIAFCLYPHLLLSTTPSVPSITIHNAASQPYGLSVGLAWWILGIILVAGYFIYVYRAFRGTVRLDDGY